jgi:hypothetical protein
LLAAPAAAAPATPAAAAIPRDEVGVPGAIRLKFDAVAGLDGARDRLSLEGSGTRLMALSDGATEPGSGKSAASMLIGEEARG